MNKYLINVYTSWCGEDQNFVAIANNEFEFRDLAELESFNNFSDFEGIEAILDEEFPEAEGDYTDEQREYAEEISPQYYGYTIREFDPETDGQFEWYEVLYSGEN